jgi:hypothetical protein
MEVDEVEEVEPVEVPADSEPAASDGEGDEEEYEIEGILDAKKGAFPQVMWSLSRFFACHTVLGASCYLHILQGRTGYFVKWKGYGEEENSWVDEKDAGCA